MATHEDPNLPHLNDTLYEYIPKAAVRELKAAYQAEARKAKANGTSCHTELKSLSEHCKGIEDGLPVTFDITRSQAAP